MKFTQIIWQYVCISCHTCVSCYVMPMPCLCVTFTSWSTPSFGMLLSKFSNRNTHVCTSSIRMISFFTLQCEFFTSCNVSKNASLLSPRTGGEGVVNQVWTGLDRGSGAPKKSQTFADIVYGWPLFGNICIAIVCWPGCDVINFEFNLILLINLFFRHDQKIRTKI